MLNKFIHKNYFQLNNILIPMNKKLLNIENNQIYNINNSITEKLFYKECFPQTFEYLNSMKKFPYLTLSIKDYNIIKNKIERLHKIFIETTKKVLLNNNEKNIYKKFNFSKNEWEFIKQNFNSNNNYLYGRMDLGFSFDLKQIKLFEYNTGLCGDIYDTTDFQNNIFNHYVDDNLLKNNSFHSGFNLINDLGKRFEFLIKNKKNKTIYIICTNNKEENLVLNSLLQSMKNKNIKYKICRFFEGIKVDNNGNLIDSENNEKIDLIFKTYSWYKIFENYNKNKNSFFKYFINNYNNVEYIEPSWKTIMGNKALLPYVYKYNKYNKNLIPSSFNPNDKIFEKDEYIIEKGIKGRGSKLTKKIKKTDIKNNKKENVIYQKIFDKNFKKNYYYIMGAYIIGNKFSGFFVKQSNKIINDYNCNVIPVRILH